MLLAGAVFTLTSSCGFLPKEAAEAQQRRNGNSRDQGSPTVDVAIAQTEALRQPREYTGTTQPIREISLRSQVEGQLLKLNADVGDRIQSGQTLAQVDDSFLEAVVISAEAELSARQAEIARLQTQVKEAETQVQRAKFQLQQAETDAKRFENLARDGAGTQQQAEQARTNALSANEVLRSTVAQVTSRQQEIASAQDRVIAQQAVIAQTKERQSYAVLRSPISGFVVARATEAGNLVQPGTELLKLGDFSSAKVMVQVSELELSTIRVGQSVQVRLDAQPNRQLIGTVARISPAANPTSRLVPVEVTMPNPTGQIGSGLLARVVFQSRDARNIVVPIAALPDLQKQRRSPNSASSSQTKPDPGKSQSKDATQGENGGNRFIGADNSNQPAKPARSTLFVVTGEGDQATVQSRSVMLGKQLDAKVEILSGLKPGDRYVARSSRPLKDGEKVRLSILSEKPGNK